MRPRDSRAPAFNAAAAVRCTVFGCCMLSMRALGQDLVLRSPSPTHGGGFGTSVSPVQDINLDGVTDIVIGAPREAEGSGRVHVFSGVDGSLLASITHPAAEDVGGRFGTCVLGWPDLNGDGRGEVIASMPLSGGANGNGRVVVLSVVPGVGSTVLSSLKIPILPADTSAYFGGSLARVEDISVSQDAALVVGAHLADPGLTPADVGRAYLFIESSLTQPAPTPTRTLRPPADVANMRFGTSVDGLGDVNSDGIDEVLVGAPGGILGQVFVHGSRDGVVLATLTPNGSALSSFGRSLAGGPNMDIAPVGDLAPDCIVGTNFQSNTGSAMFCRPGSGAIVSHVSIPSNPDSPVGDAGAAVAIADDWNGDGSADMVVGAPNSASLGVSGSGAVYVRVSNQTRTILDPDLNPFDRFGAAVANCPDLDGDGTSELVIGAPGSNVSDGFAYVAFGRNRLYVDAGAAAGGDGRNWGTAFNSLQAALDFSRTATGDWEVWVAHGEYRPGAPGGSFDIPSNTALYGGFEWGMQSIADRDQTEASLSILSGDIAGDDGAGGFNDNATSVLTISSPSVLVDGFTIRSGIARVTGGPTPGPDAGLGGGVSIAFSSPVFQFCTFQGNTAEIGGGGVAIADGTPRFLNCSFLNNASAGDGGAVHRSGNDLTMTEFRQCNFVGNTAGETAGSGGAIHVSNTGAFGGGLSCNECIFQNNSAAAGGAIFVDGLLQHVHVGLSRFHDNHAFAGSGGAILFSDASAASETAIVNSEFFLNTATMQGGAIFMPGGPSCFLDFCSLTKNHAGRSGGGVYQYPTFGQTTTPQVKHCILWGNTDLSGATADAQIFSPSESNAGILYSCIQGAPGHPIPPGGVSLDPRLANTIGVDVPTGIEASTRLILGSPYIDAGNAMLIPPDRTDYDADGDTAELIPLGLGGARTFDDPFAPNVGVPPSPLGPIPDIGAWEFHPTADFTRWTGANSNNFFVNANWTNSRPGAGTVGVFDSSVPISVNCSNSTTPRIIAGLMVVRNAVELLLPLSSNLTLNGEPDTLVIGPYEGAGAPPASLTITGGPLQTGTVFIGRDFNSIDTRLIVGSSGALRADGAIHVRRGVLQADGHVDVDGNVEVWPLGRLEGAGPIQGSLRNAGVVRPSTTTAFATLALESPLDVAAFYEQDQRGRLELRIGGTTPELMDRISVDGSAQLSGLLDISLSGYDPMPGDEFDLISVTGNLNGRFAVAFLPTLPSQRFLRVNYGDALRGSGGRVFLDVGALRGEAQVDAPATFPLDPGVARGAATDDLNRDGLPDLAIVAQNAVNPLTTAGSVIILFNGGNDANGEWLGYTSSISMPVGVDPSSVAIGDFDDANGNDLVIANQGDSTVQTFLQSAVAGTFAAGDLIPVGAAPSAVASPDLNRDGLADIGVTCIWDDVTMFFLSEATLRGGEGFGLLGAFATEDEPTDITPIDADGDKDSDILIVNKGSGSLSVMKNDVPDGGAFPQMLTVGVQSGPISIAAANLGGINNADGDPTNDFVIVNQASGSLSIVQNTTQGAGSALSVAAPASIPVGDLPNAVAILDIEGDGDNDIITLTKQTGPDPSTEIKLLRNDSAGDQIVVSAPQVLALSDELIEVLTTDVNLDGAPDIVVVGAPAPEGLRGTGGGGAGAVDVLLNNSVTPCPCDLNRSGLDSQDFFDFLEAFFGGGRRPADVNHSGGVDSQDYFDFVECFFGGCEG